MLFLVIKKEILDHLLSLRFAISCVICFVVILSSVFVLTKEYKEDLLDYRTNVVMHRNEVLDYDNPNNLMSQGIRADKPLNVMKVFLKGISRKNTTSARIFSFGEPEFEAVHEGNPLVYLFPTIDLIFFVSIIMSLLAIAFSYDAISGEKEGGTLRLMMSYSVPRDTVLLAKWIGGYIALVAPFLIAILCGLIVTLLFPEAHMTDVNWAQFFLILAVSLLYIAAIFSLGLFVSSRTAMASTSITVLLLIWVLMVLVVPNLSPYVASQISPTRPMQVVEKEKAGIERELIQNVMKEFNEWREAKEKEGPIDWQSEEVTKYIRELREGIAIKIAEAQKKLADDFTQGMIRQVDLAANISRVSPMAPFVYAAAQISGTGTEEREHFLKTLDRYQRNWISYGEDKNEEFAAIMRARQAGEKAEEFNVEDYPKFHYEAPLLKDQVQGSLKDVGVLAAWTIVLFLGAFVSFLRYDVM